MHHRQALRRRSTGRSSLPRALAALAAVVAAFALTAASCQPPPPGGGGTTSSTSSTIPDGSTDSVEIGEETVTVEVPTGLTVSVEAADPSGLPPAASGFDAPLGALDITVGGLTPGDATQVVVTFERSIDLVQKLIDGTWQTFTHDGTTGTTLAPDGRSVTLDLLDGGRGDTDGLADGTIVDPLLPLDADGLQITTTATPFIEPDAPYSLQLETVGGEPDAEVTWTVVEGTPPAGLTLDPSGEVSGTNAGTNTTQYPAPVRVQATDGTTTDTKLLLFASVAAGGSEATGATLPEGSALDVTERTASPMLQTADVLHSDGTLDTAEHMDLATLQRVSTAVSPDGTLVALRWDTGFNPSSGPMSVVDTDTGATAASLAVGVGSSPQQARWSPDGSHLVLPDYQSVVGPLYETTGWTLVRQLDHFGHGEVRWSDDGSTLFNTAGTGTGTPTEVHLLEGPDFTDGPTISVPTADCTAHAISVTDRLAVTCPGGFGSLRTMSAADGSDERELFDGCSSPLVLPCMLLPQHVSFSPSGDHLVFTAQEVVTLSPMAGNLVVAAVPDQVGEASTTLLRAPLTGALEVVRWR